MNTLRRLCAALVLTMALSLSAFAGQIDTMDTAPPPPDSQAATTGEIQTTVAGQMDTTLTGDMQAGVTATDSTVLNLLQSVLSIF